MTNANVTSLVSSTIAILKATTKSYNIVSDDKGLRDAFHEAGRGLLLVEEALQPLAGDPQSAMSSLEACNAKAKLSESIFKDVAQALEASRFERYKVAVRQVGKGNMVEVLVKGMMNDACDLVKNSAIEAAMKTQIKGLHDAIDKLSTMEPSVPNEQLCNTFSNYGSGSQFNAPRGTQNNSTGSGNQFPGASFSGPVHFGNNPS
ncbi:hypothetical protein BDZ45DRAFT_680600 [Acephala macrosclerotiorum]|nr:hypothetical protein BDZ45DRAFT_680600 [Acephala macrosclerotiorum]